LPILARLGGGTRAQQLLREIMEEPSSELDDIDRIAAARPSILELAGAGTEGIVAAVREHGYGIVAVASALRMHRTTVARLLLAHDRGDARRRDALLGSDLR
jgi:hypothetical protein